MLKQLTTCLFILSSLISCASFSEVVLKWELIGPGDADQVTSLSVLRNRAVFAGTDVGGLYISTDEGDSWKAKNTGLNNYDVTTSVFQDKNNSDILYVGTRGGFYKSVNSGDSWVNLRNGLPSKKETGLSGSIGSIAIDPKNSEHIILGMGYRPSGDGTKTVKKLKWLDVIYESFDSGDSWSSKKAFDSTSKVYQLKFSTKEPGMIYAATSTGLYSGRLEGRPLNRILNKHCYNILIFDDRAGYIVAACDDDAIYISNDNGEHWSNSKKGLGFSAFNKHQRYSVLVGNKNNPDNIYLINSVWNSDGGLYKSSDRGVNWKKISKKMPESWLSTSNKMNAVAIDPTNPNLIYLGSSRYLYKSNDGGSTWSQIISRQVMDGWTNRGINVFGHTRDIVVDSSNKNKIYIATADHGLIASEDAGKSWKNVTRNISHSNFVWDIEQCATNKNVFYWVGSDIKKSSCLYKNDKTFTTWLPQCASWDRRESAKTILIHPLDCNQVYVGTNNKILKTPDAGKTWKRIGNGLLEGRVYALASSSDGKNLYAGLSDGLYTSHNNGKDWQLIKSLKNAKVVSILVSRTDPDFLLIGTESNKHKNGGLFLSHNAGNTVTKVLDVRKMVSGIVQHPIHEEVFFISTNDHNYHDDSSGSGIFYSKDMGNNWEAINDGLPVKRAWNISISNAAHKVFLSANGSGGYTLDLNQFDSLIK